MKALMLLLTCGAALAADTNAFLDSWTTAQSKLKTWSADFVQTRSLKALKQPVTTPGRLVFAAPGDFRWELGIPAQTIAIRAGNEFTISYPKLNKVEKYPLTGQGNEPWREALSLMDAGFPANRAELEARFNIVSVRASNDVMEVSMEPKSLGARRFMTEVQLVVRTNDFSMIANRLRFVDGSTLRNDFTNAVKTLKE